MILDPYSILGVSKDATKDEIKSAYRKKAKLYHPDLHPDDPKASEKMNELNEAYEMAMNPEKYRYDQQRRQGQSSSYADPFGGFPFGNGTYGGSPFGSGTYRTYTYGSPFGRTYTYYRSNGGSIPYAPGDNKVLKEVVDHINAGRFNDAISGLGTIATDYRNARWYYLAALAHRGLQNTAQAFDFIKKACRMEPDNLTYQMTMQQMTGSAYRYQSNSQVYNAARMQRLCLTLCMLNMCLGGRIPICCFC